MCEWIWELELLKNFLRILSEWFTKHLEIKLSERARGFESHRLRQEVLEAQRFQGLLFFLKDFSIPIVSGKMVPMVPRFVVPSQ